MPFVQIEERDLLAPQNFALSMESPGLVAQAMRLFSAFTVCSLATNIMTHHGRVAELADAKDLGSFGAILAGSTPVAPTIVQRTLRA